MKLIGAVFFIIVLLLMAGLVGVVGAKVMGTVKRAKVKEDVKTEQVRSERMQKLASRHIDAETAGAAGAAEAAEEVDIAERHRMKAFK